MERITVLLVENEALNALFFQEELTRLGCELCASVTTGEAAIVAAAEHRPDLILMDIGLDGDMDGIEAAGEIVNARPTPIIFLSGYTDDDTLARARGVKPYGYLVKPFTEGSLNATLQMVLERLASERELARSQQRLREAALVFDATQDGILILDRDHRISSVNHRFTALTGFTPQELEGAQPYFLDHGILTPELLAQIGAHEGRWSSQISVQKRDGSSFPATVTIAGVRDVDTHTGHHVVLISDLTAVRAAEEKLYRMAHHDPLTGLPNRQLMMDRLKLAIEQAKRHRSRMAVLFIDLDRFKQVNDSLGHAAGDEMLRTVAARMERCVRSVDTVARLGGDEFLIVLDDIDDNSAVALVAQKLLDTLSQPIAIASASSAVNTSASIGISLFPEAGTTPDQLIHAADAAMYEAKSQGRDAFVFHSPRNRRVSNGLGTLQRELFHAIRSHKLELYYQPQVNLESGRVVGLEALLRWPHPQRGMIDAGEVLPLAQAGDQMDVLSRWALRTACRQLAEWTAAGIKPPRMAINVSDCQLFDPQLVSELESCLEEFGVAGELVELEVAESAVQDKSADCDTFAALRKLGVGLTVHNYGSGQTSLTALNELPVRRVKIDRRLVARLDQGGAPAALVNAIIAVARELQFTASAEGIENAAQTIYLLRHGCHEAQGNYYSPPLPAAAVLPLLRSATIVPLRRGKVEAAAVRDR
jgi:diguanylate cyclase (GGDEF)-like protein/PAS domain S-box-containing protein